MDPKQMLAFALDEPDLSSALAVLDLVAPEVGIVKVGLELFVREGPLAVKAVLDRGSRVFLDLKLHDIPQTVEGAARSAAALGVDLLTVHAAGGAEMLRRACSATAGTSTRVVAVTVLTSLGADSMGSIGLSLAPGEWVDRLTSLATRAGCAGVVCSPQEVASVRARFPDALLITPGIRPAAGLARDDQARVATPEDAIRDGADLLVVGRPIRMAADPAAQARAIVERIGQALQSPRARQPR